MKAVRVEAVAVAPEGRWRRPARTCHGLPLQRVQHKRMTCTRTAGTAVYRLPACVKKAA